MRAATGRVLLRAATSVMLLAVVALVVDVGDVLRRLVGLDIGWVLAAAAVSVVQVIVSAWRWRYTAARLGVALPLPTAVAEYYLGTFLNQLLPGGVLGDVSRAWRHASVEEVSDAPPDAAVHAVILERASGQVVMTMSAAVAAALLAIRWREIAVSSAIAVSVALAVCFGVAAAFIAFRAVSALVRRRSPHRVDRFLDDARSALLGGALPVQAVVSVGIVASYVVVFVLGARAVGLEAPTALLALTAPPVLVAMLIPVSVAGWGLREGAAAALWGFVGLPAADGVAVSVAYGLLVFVTSLPGAAVLVLRPRAVRAPDRRGDPSRG